ncbi:hypothetical protein [Abyssibacter profundi]|uniref:Uncharacterized protein n=1 Tax=Abyssibacter profundi TaxID=2182787 RepID=A0A363UKV4_9GAMM|nr:hypothetical protein [Abyssibacter profundi]PWN56044.1 hypothetical protein DEH80_09535 [Abyssibacter profundi]
MDHTGRQTRLSMASALLAVQRRQPADAKTPDDLELRVQALLAPAAPTDAGRVQKLGLWTLAGALAALLATVALSPAHDLIERVLQWLH